MLLNCWSSFIDGAHTMRTIPGEDHYRYEGDGHGQKSEVCHDVKQFAKMRQLAKMFRLKRVKQSPHRTANVIERDAHLEENHKGCRIEDVRFGVQEAQDGAGEILLQPARLERCFNDRDANGDPYHHVGQKVQAKK